MNEKYIKLEDTYLNIKNTQKIYKLVFRPF